MSELQKPNRVNCKIIIQELSSIHVNTIILFLNEINEREQSLQICRFNDRDKLLLNDFIRTLASF